MESSGTGPADTGKETGRIEAFSDGVFAIAITLLVLDFKPPDLSHPNPRWPIVLSSRLLGALIYQWPTFLAFGLSFLTILIMWVNHHTLFQHIKRVDHIFLMLNGLLLLGVTFVPFPTSVLAENIQQAQLAEGKVAAAFYSSTFLFIAILFNRVWHYASYQDRLLGHLTDRHAIEAISRAYRFGPLWYLLAAVMATFSAGASVAINVALALFFALPSSLAHHVGDLLMIGRRNRRGGHGHG